MLSRTEAYIAFYHAPEGRLKYRGSGFGDRLRASLCQQNLIEMDGEYMQVTVAGRTWLSSWYKNEYRTTKRYAIVLSYSAECCDKPHLFDTRVEAKTELRAYASAQKQLRDSIPTADIYDDFVAIRLGKK